MSEDGKVIVHGNYYEIKNNTFYGGSQSFGTSTDAQAGNADEPVMGDEADVAVLAGVIAGCFYGDVAKAEDFLRKMKGMTDRQITQYVGRLVGEDKISPLSYGKVLWQHLYDAGWYQCSLSNWNRQIKACF